MIHTKSIISSKIDRELVDFIASRSTSCMDLERLTKENIHEEFEILGDLVDFNEEHQRNLHQVDGGYDRYSDILPCIITFINLLDKYNFVTTSEGNYVNGSYISVKSKILNKNKSFRLKNLSSLHKDQYHRQSKTSGKCYTITIHI
jgi:hypothetical protein